MKWQIWHAPDGTTDTLIQEVRDIIGRWDTFEGDSGDLIRMMERIDEHIGLRESDDSEEQEDVE